MFAKASEERVFRFLYERGKSSKKAIADNLGLSLPTVSSALATFASEGLVSRRGSFPSTGGRPAEAYELRTDARYSIGIELVADRVRVAFIDLIGTVLSHSTLEIRFAHTEAYLQDVARYLEREMAGSGLPRERLLGATIAIQGIVSADGSVTFGGLLGAGGTGILLDDFAAYLDMPLYLAHDAEAAAYAEAWRHHEVNDFAYLSLNDHLGSALVRGGKIMRSSYFGAGIAEHMVAVPQGAPCYCGNRGCFETLLGAEALERQAQTTVPGFFERRQACDPVVERLWDRYLDYLALLIHNLRMVGCGDVIVGGRISRYLTQGDLRALRAKVSDMGTLSKHEFRLLRGHYRDAATALGAGIMVINRYLDGTLGESFSAKH